MLRTPVRTALLSLTLLGTTAAAEDPWVVYEGGEGPGKGTRIVLVSGDEEYRSEEGLPQLGKILATRHGFTCTVLFAIDPETGEIDPNNIRNIPGLEALEDAELMIIAARMRDLPDEQMRHVVDYVESGRPIIGIRTATHAFKLPGDSTFGHYSWDSKAPGWEGGFGRKVLGETWISHHGAHGKESTRGVVAPDAEGHPITRGIDDGDIWGPTDVYGVRLPLPGDSQPIILGQVLGGMSPEDPPVEGEKNDPMMPIAWTKTFDGARVFATTAGSSVDLESEGLRRLLVNACYWCLGMEGQIPEGGTEVDLVGEYAPTPFGFNGYTRGVTPSDLAIEGPGR
ncbi:ThuA domain-containing protein [Tautonia plasticadhaerens]|uniref:Trehalose utilization n=1 Tax=Tautonia plasticadhaerens TaxID=2527974 RepID=A0A518H5P0_9BACT|nr:ThuA domain-containing protein [Tautonia plasticadhaerens]QDV36150.1 Trehalose utilization [Tautonia plasticadhaerens]